MEIKDFLLKVKENEAKKLKLIQINVEGYGNIEFMRPKTEDMFSYYEAMADSDISIDIENTEDPENIEKKEDVKTQNLKDMGLKELPKIVKASSTLIYNCSSFLKSKELRNMYPGIHNFDIPVEIFGWGEVIEIASQIIDKFGGSEEVKKDIDLVDTEIKN